MSSTPNPASRITVFDVPALPPLAAVRDRVTEAAERNAMLREDGYVAGYQAGLDAASSQVAIEVAEHRRAVERLGAAVHALEAAARELAGRDQVSLQDIERDAVALGVALAEGILGHELACTDAPVLDALRRAAALAPDRGTPVVRVHPDDAATTREATAADVLTWRGDVSVVPDPTIERGGCIVDVGPCRIDGQVGSAIDRVRSALVGDDDLNLVASRPITAQSSS